MHDVIPIAIREAEATDQDRGYAFGTLLRFFRYRGNHAMDTDSSSYFDGHHEVLERLFARGAKLSLATPPDDSRLILGYALHEPRLLHFIFVRETHRDGRIGTRLLESIKPSPDFYTHKTPDWTSFLQGKRPFMRWAPYLVVWPYNGDARDEERKRSAEKSARRARMPSNEITMPGRPSRMPGASK